MDGMLGIVGCGQMGEAVLGGLLDAGVCEPEQIVVSGRREQRIDELAERYGVRGGSGAEANAAALATDVVVLGLKPQVLPDVLGAQGAAVRSDALVVSLAAGVTTQRIDSFLPNEPAIVRVMTNTPALVGRAASVVAAGPRADRGHLLLVHDMLRPLGAVRTLPESTIDAVTAVAGSGPAYVLLLAEALADAGVSVGLSREDAVALATQTVAGAGALLAAGDATATELRERVTSPGGTTAAAVRVLEQQGLRGAVIDAVHAAVERARELG